MQVNLFLKKVELRKVYHKYCGAYNEDPERRVLTRSTVWKLLMDMKLTLKGVTLGTFKKTAAELDRAYARVFKGDPFCANRYTVAWFKTGSSQSPL
jgi:hypothetical protein